MAVWKREDAEYHITVPNEPQLTRFMARLVYTEPQVEQSKLVLEDHPENQGMSVLVSPAREAAITKIASKWKDGPEEAAWFALDGEGKLHTISLRYELVKQADQRYLDLVNSNDLNREDAAAAKRYFPEIQVKELRTGLSDIRPEQQRALSQAFARVERTRKFEPER